MLIGIMSDSHGQHRMVTDALRCFDALGVEHVVHCGDICGTAVLDQLVGRPCTFVWGNMDTVDRPLCRYLESVGLPIPPKPPVRLELGGKTFLVFHGHEQGISRAIREMEPHYALHGHTHAVRDEYIGNIRLINPGALARANPKTVAALDTVADTVIFHAFDENSGTFAPWSLSP
ncbi:MAG: YfcE family phosphodiesterase [Phycisphaerae bacterium]|nr:YfcE family phosphodiesterase [Phycisphaerae bacterium]